jgi:hypothetical protein
VARAPEPDVVKQPPRLSLDTLPQLLAQVERSEALGQRVKQVCAHVGASPRDLELLSQEQSRLRYAVEQLSGEPGAMWAARVEKELAHIRHGLHAQPQPR